MSKRLNKNRTTTLSDGSGNPLAAIFPGHIGAVAFNKAYAAEGWKSDWIPKEELKHEFWAATAKGWEKSQKGHPGAQPVTVNRV
jgi:hypothetical protein